MAQKTAAILHSMVGNQCFADGNKRMAWLLAELLIERSGYRLAIPDDERIDDLVVAVASGQMTFAELVAWFAPAWSKDSPLPKPPHLLYAPAICDVRPTPGAHAQDRGTAAMGPPDMRRSRQGPDLQRIRQMFNVTKKSIQWGR